MDVKKLAKGADTMRWIDVSVVLCAEAHAPVVAVFVPVGGEVVAVPALNVDDISKNALTGHPEAGHFKGIVAAVLQHHAVHARALCSLYQSPAFLHGGCCRNLQGHVLAAFHGVDAHCGVKLPGGSHVHKVKVRELTETLPGIRTRELLCRSTAFIGQYFLRVRHGTGIQVT